MYKKLFFKGFLGGILIAIIAFGYFIQKYINQKEFNLSKVEIYDLENKKIDLTTIGKPYVLNFMSIGCGPCRKELPHLSSAYKSKKDSISFFIVLDNSIEDIKEFQKEQKLDLNLYYSKKSFEDYGILGVPRTYFINSDGKIADSSKGSMDSLELNKKLKNLN